jgi:two-component system chemotaxis response regulator CheY
VTVPAACRFLVVDDCAPMRRIVRGLLHEIGWHDSAEAADGALALALLRRSRFDAVVTDINMPVVNGYELLCAIRADAALCRLPVLLILPEPRDEDTALAAQYGASGVLVRPFGCEALATALRHVLPGQPVPG